MRKLQLGLIGDGISRTSAHKLQKVLGELCGIDIDYELIDANGNPNFSVQDTLQKCAEEGYRGVNITHPHKQIAYEHSTPSSEIPAGLTSVNTVLFEDGAMPSFNTDYTGCIRSFRAALGVDTTAGKVFQLGAGGVGIAMAHAWAKLNAESISIYDTNEAQSGQLVTSLRKMGVDARVANADLKAEAERADGLVNATPIGMYQYPGNPFPDGVISNQRWAYEAIYQPINTPFYQSAVQGGLNCISGFKLFFYQGLDCFEHFSGETVDAETGLEAFLKKHPLD